MTMDPQATWQLLLETWGEGNHLDARDIAEDLQIWLDQDGFCPQAKEADMVPDEFNCVMVRAVVTLVLKSVC